jgi:exodeoxyribonuclease VII small subunit
MSKAKPADYQALQAELDAIMLALQQEDLDVDQAVQYYERGLKLVGQLQAYLKTAENKVTELKAKFNGPQP